MAEPAGPRPAALLPAWLAAAAAVALAAVLLAFAGLLPGGHWDPDEYYNAALLRRYGWRFAWARFYTWSPRPVSETALWLYLDLVMASGRQLIAPFLGLLWALLTGGALWASRRPGEPGAAWRLCLALGLPVLFLVRLPVFEMFYWPMGAAPYLLAITGVLVLALLLVGGRTATRGGRWAAAGALLLAAGSSETGLFFALGFCATLLIADLVLAWRGVPAPAERVAGYRVIGLIALLPLGLLLRYRVANAAAGLTTGSATFHDVGASLLAAARELPADLLRDRTFGPAFAAPQTLLLWALAFVGMTLSLRAGLPARAAPVRHMLALAGGCAGSIGISLFAAFYQFGTLCCERHHTFRACLVVVLLLALAGLANRRTWLPAALCRIGGPLALLGAVGAGLSGSLPGLLADYRALPEIRHAEAQNWTALHDPATGAVAYRLPPRGAVLGGAVWPTGHFVAGDAATPFPYDALLRFSGKSSVDAMP